MYAIIILDLKKQRMVMACDPLGIKPLYWARHGDTWVVASTIRAIPTEFIGQVRRFPGGEVWTTDGKRRSFEPVVKTQGTLLDELRFAVQSHLPEEVPWGCMLSGGIDSSLVTALAKECTNEPVLAFTVGEEGSQDVEYAKKFADELGLSHHIVELNRDKLQEVIERVIECTATYSSDIVMNGVGTLLAAQAAASDGVKVLLSGEGADELFGGYDQYLRVPIEELNRVLTEQQNDLGATECLRLDRCTMAYGVEARVPYLSTRVVQLAHRIPPQQKIMRQLSVTVKKYCLRESARSILPSWIVEREKIPLYQGSELGEVLNTIATRQIGSEELKEFLQSNTGFPFINLMEVWFFQIWRKKYPRLAQNWFEMVDRGLVRRFGSPLAPHRSYRKNRNERKRH